MLLRISKYLMNAADSSPGGGAPPTAEPTTEAPTDEAPTERMFSSAEVARIVENDRQRSKRHARADARNAANDDPVEAFSRYEQQARQLTPTTPARGAAPSSKMESLLEGLLAIQIAAMKPPAPP